jgi:hypothetical protein
MRNSDVIFIDRQREDALRHHGLAEDFKILQFAHCE